jgi:hypothetical protein
MPLTAAALALAACSGAVAASTPPDSGSGQHDAAVAEGGGGTPGEDASGHPDAQAAVDGPSGCTTPASMFTAPIAPPVYAGIDLSKGGKGDVTIDDIAATHCAGTPGAASEPGYDAWTWGDGAVEVDFNPTTRVPYYVSMGKGYSGTIAFASRAGGAWGKHAYVVGVGAMTRDGAPFLIDWSGGKATATKGITELADAYYATWVPSHAAEPTDCTVDSSCGIFANDALGHSSFGIRAKPYGALYVESPLSSSSPDMLYTFWWDGELPAAPPDAGAD